MRVLIAYSTTFGTTRALAQQLGAAFDPEHAVRVLPAREAGDVDLATIDLLLVGAPTQFGGKLLGVRGFLSNLKKRRPVGLLATAFDTRMPGEIEKTGSAAAEIGGRLTAAGCRLVVPPVSFLSELRGPLEPGEPERAKLWAKEVAAAALASLPATAPTAG